MAAALLRATVVMRVQGRCTGDLMLMTCSRQACWIFIGTVRITVMSRGAVRPLSIESGRELAWAQCLSPLKPSHEMLLCQLTNVPVGLSFQAHTCNV